MVPVTAFDTSHLASSRIKTHKCLIALAKSDGV